MRSGEDEAPVIKVVATGISLVVGLADDMQITFQTGFEGDETDEAVNARVDRLVRIAERQKAIAKLDKLERDLVQQKETLAQQQEDYARIDLQTNQAIAKREVELGVRKEQGAAERAAFIEDVDNKIATLLESRQRAYDAGLEEHRRTGRSGSYVPRGAHKQAIDNTDRAIVEMKANRDGAIADFDRDYEARLHTAEAEIEKAKAEREQALRSIEISIERYTAAIESTEAMLEKARTLKGA